ncbi:MAG: cupredoxin domain-containing protein [Chloroflexi bacterium]|nr:cupredoxin domain-containing protein [Chloroflexota bacterium]
MRLFFALALAFFFTALALGSLRAFTARAAPPAAVAGIANVSIASFAFSPSVITVPVGTTVVWTNNDPFTHTATSDAAIWDSGQIGPGQVFSMTFNAVGDFPYHCNIHILMHGTVVVTGSVLYLPTIAR